MRVSKRAITALGFLLATACGGADGQEPSSPSDTSPAAPTAPSGRAQRNTKFFASCDSRSNRNECTDFYSDHGNEQELLKGLQQNCVKNGTGDISMQPCPNEGLIGSCEQSIFVVFGQSSTSVTDRSYAPISLDLARVRCQSGTFTQN